MKIEKRRNKVIGECLHLISPRALIRQITKRMHQPESYGILLSEYDAGYFFFVHQLLQEFLLQELGVQGIFFKKARPLRF